MNVVRIDNAINDTAKEHELLLQEAYQASIKSVDYFQTWFFEKLKSLGLEAEEFRVTDEEFKSQPAFHRTYDDSISKVDIPKNVIGYVNKDSDDGILLYAHADKVPVTFEYGKKQPEIIEERGRYFGAGIADDVSGIAAMISALKVCKDLGLKPRKKIMLSSILGKQSGVFGTYGLMKKFGSVKSAIYLHPAESGLGLGELKVSSNGIVEFSISVKGKPPECTELAQAIFTDTAVSAIDKIYEIKKKLSQWSEEQSEKYHHESLHDLTGHSFAVMISKISGGSENAVIEVPLSCRADGMICFPPNVGLKKVKDDFEAFIKRISEEDPWLSENMTFQYGDMISESGESDINSKFIKTSVNIVSEQTGKVPQFWYGHTMSDIRYPMLFWGAETYGIGPLAGDIGQETEWVDKDEYMSFIAILAKMIWSFSG